MAEESQRAMPEGLGDSLRLERERFTMDEDVIVLLS